MHPRIGKYLIGGIAGAANALPTVSFLKYGITPENILLLVPTTIFNIGALVAYRAVGDIEREGRNLEKSLGIQRESRKKTYEGMVKGIADYSNRIREEIREDGRRIREEIRELGEKTRDREISTEDVMKILKQIPIN